MTWRQNKLTLKRRSVQFRSEASTEFRASNRFSWLDEPRSCFESSTPTNGIDHSSQDILASSSCRRIARTKVYLDLTLLVVAIYTHIAKDPVLSMILNGILIESDHHGFHGAKSTAHVARYGLGEASRRAQADSSYLCRGWCFRHLCRCLLSAADP